MPYLFYICVLFVIFNINIIFGLDQNEIRMLELTAGMKDNDKTAIDGITRLLQQGVDANIKSDDGESVLHLSCIWGNSQKIKLLLQFGANPNARANQTPSSLNMTPLSWCVYGGHTEAIKEFLSDERTNINLIVRQEDQKFITALDIAYKIEDMGIEIVDLLKNAGGKRYEELRNEYEHVEDIPELYFK